jgi:hypothetical protein
MRSILGATFLVVAIIFAILTPLFVFTWYDHTQWVQSMVEEDIEEFREIDVDWASFDINRPAYEMSNDVSDVVLRMPGLFSTGIRDERYAYQDALYDLIMVIVNEPDNHELLNDRLIDATVAQINLYTAAEVFTSNTLYAMRFTF